MKELKTVYGYIYKMPEVRMCFIFDGKGDLVGCGDMNKMPLIHSTADLYFETEMEAAAEQKKVMNKILNSLLCAQNISLNENVKLKDLPKHKVEVQKWVLQLSQ